MCQGVLLALLAASPGCADEESVLLTGDADAGGWAQWGRDASHRGQARVVGQPLDAILADVPLDPFIEQEIAEVSDEHDGERALLVHYQAPLTSGDDVFVQTKGGTFTPCIPPGSGTPAPCGADAWDRLEWREEKYTYRDGELTFSWRFASDWKPPPSGWATGGWEPVFHAVLAGAYVLVPGAGGSVWAVDRETGAEIERIDPFHGEARGTTFVAGPLTVTAAGDVYYHAIRFLDVPRRPREDAWPKNGWDVDIEGAWLVHIAPDGQTSMASFADLVPGAPGPEDGCVGSFGSSSLPWPPDPDAVPSRVYCGSQRPGLNAAPAVAEDGTIYTVSRAHFAGRESFVVAVGPDLTPRWAASLQGHLQDGCGTETLPPTGALGGCRQGAKTGVDPATNEPPAGIVFDVSTASPVVTPDGGVLYGAYTRYNGSRGHLFRFSAGGEFLGAYPFGWDITPAIHEHDGTWSIVLKENHYDVGSYCNDDELCPPAEEGPFYVTQLSPDMEVEWQFQLTNTQSCKRAEDGTVTCVEDHPTGFEWCINAPAVDREGTVYANGEDGVLYAIPQGGGEARSLFLGEAIGAAYTPLAVDGQGRIYAQNIGRLFVVGSP